MIDYLQTKYSLLINKNVILNLQSLAAHKGRCRKHPKGGYETEQPFAATIPQPTPIFWVTHPYSPYFLAVKTALYLGSSLTD